MSAERSYTLTSIRDRPNERLVAGVRRRKGAFNFMKGARMPRGWVAIEPDMAVTTQRLVLFLFVDVCCLFICGTRSDVDVHCSLVKLHEIPVSTTDVVRGTAVVERSPLGAGESVAEIPGKAVASTSAAASTIEVGATGAGASIGALTGEDGGLENLDAVLAESTWPDEYVT